MSTLERIKDALLLALVTDGADNAFYDIDSTDRILQEELGQERECPHNDGGSYCTHCGGHEHLCKPPFTQTKED